MKSRRVFSLAQEKAIRIAHRTGRFGHFVGERDATGVALQRVGVLRRRRSGSNDFLLTDLGQLVAEALEARGISYVDFGRVITGSLPAGKPSTSPDQVETSADSNPVRSHP